MNLYQLCEGIQLDEGARQTINQFHIDDKSYNQRKLQFISDRFAFFDSVKESPSYRETFLALFARFAVDAYEEYRSRGISDDIYYDTFSDLQIWCKKCYQDFGVYGIEEYGWLQEHVQLRLFRLGRLQFQPISLDQDVKAEGRKLSKGELALNVHIPEGESLDGQSVERSFEMAKSFFRGISSTFVCHSWLLYPQLSEVLPPTSNILKFQKNFVIYEVDHDAKQAEERIFNRVCEDPSLYEERTSLQQSAKAYLMAGNQLGNGYGVIF
ncbi:acyltransferase domain-containing protein [Paenibacillus sp. LHD-117]|uniref:acyltransferase domain-containing protein n=1 Tax=Paenibacillus sp. LHD-117 TaxID=3071412 RepID=UPI0027E07DBD|nr:acyltransferase domain-containing protein [Paenibacillus sp. LHD-117]MDQ6419684.1 acyltransferase domain-containing protein [Paenibacillus sp. LHD-117]